MNLAELAMRGSFPTPLGQADPQDLLAQLRSATEVRQVGPASGPGWTGTAYTFSAKTTVTVDVDQRGMVRQVDALESFARTVREPDVHPVWLISACNLSGAARRRRHIAGGRGR